MALGAGVCAVPVCAAPVDAAPIQAALVGAWHALVRVRMLMMVRRWAIGGVVGTQGWLELAMAWGAIRGISHYRLQPRRNTMSRHGGRNNGKRERVVQQRQPPPRRRRAITLDVAVAAKEEREMLPPNGMAGHPPPPHCSFRVCEWKMCVLCSSGRSCAAVALAALRAAYLSFAAGKCVPGRGGGRRRGGCRVCPGLRVVVTE